jgi:tight adherence protein B
MFDGANSIYLIYAAAALCGIMVAEAFYLLLAGSQSRKKAINRRVKLQDKKISQEQVLIQLRKERGADSRGIFGIFEGLRHLRMQSGMTTPMPQFLMMCAAAVVVAAGVLIYLGVEAAMAVLLTVPGYFLVPFMVLRFMRKSRHKKFGVQLPEALELITRSLKAGHPVPVAIGMVGREMADPIGTEFGIVADEVTYGSDLVTALANMFTRVGHEDLPLFVTAVSIQSTSGGNLREILDGLSNVIRERGKLRRKIRSISTEGRMSAYILTAIPALLFAGMQVIMPNFYNSVLDQSLTWYLIGGAVTWLALGNAIMFKMSNFKF